ncbi:MAG: hypothetical protein ABI540_10160 [Spartobacteria bacterium]
MKINRFAFFALLTLAGSVPAFSDTTFTATGVIDMIPTSMSDDATIIVGTGIFGVPNLYYTEASGASIIGDGCFSGLPAISGDGTTILGCHEDAQGKWNAAKWLGGTSWQDLGTVAGGVPCDFFLSGAWGVNQNGSLGVGLVYFATLCKAGAGTWDLVNGGSPTALPSLFGETTYSRANAVNADGSVIVGWQDQPSGQRTAAKWVNGVEELILTANGGFNGEAQAVSADGKAIVGTGYNFSRLAWIWRDGDGVRAIGHSDGQSYTALDVSDDGKLAVGFATNNNNFKNHAFVWRRGNGAMNLGTFLKYRGAIVPAGWQLNVASLISPDGSIIYGWGVNPDGFIEMFKVDLNAPAAGPSQ